MDAPQSRLASDVSGAEDYGWRECVEVALEVAERLLMEAPNYDAETRLVSADDLLRIVQELNAASRHDESSPAVSSQPSTDLPEPLGP